MLNFGGVITIVGAHLVNSLGLGSFFFFEVPGIGKGRMVSSKGRMVSSKGRMVSSNETETKN